MAGLSGCRGAEESEAGAGCAVHAVDRQRQIATKLRGIHVEAVQPGSVT